MSNVVARSIFNTTVAERNWRTYVTSGIVHAIVIGAAFLIVIPVAKVTEPPRDHVTLVAPVLHPYVPKIVPLRIQHLVKLTMPALPQPVTRSMPAPVHQPDSRLRPISKPIPPPVVVSEPHILADIKPAQIKPDLPAAAKPVLKTGTFDDNQIAKNVAVPKQVIVGGFGDPRGVHVSAEPKPSPVLMARVGNFDSPDGAGQTGGGGHLTQGTVKLSGFGNAGAPDRTNGNQAGRAAVRSSGFGDTVASAPPQRREAPSIVAAYTPVEILFKPRPSYSPEARGMRLEGQVSLEVVFQATGAVRVVRIVRGLGHGLDEAAEQAALQVRFKPATRSGAPVDQNATISITFEIT
jgi:TonB family protein